MGLLHSDEFADSLSRISRSDTSDDGPSIALLCKLSDGGKHSTRLKTGKSTAIKDGRLFVCFFRLNCQYQTDGVFVRSMGTPSLHEQSSIL